MENNELYHYGILGMRWGVRRYQNADGTLTTAGKKKYAKEAAKIKSEKAKLAEQKKRIANQQKVKAKFDKLDAEKAKIAAEKKALKDIRKGKSKSADIDKSTSIEDRKAAILKSRSAKKLYENADIFDYKELNDAYNRLNLERNIGNLSSAEVSKGKQFINDIVSYGKTANDVLDTGTKAWNHYAKIHNAFADSSDKLPIIGDNSNKNKNKDKDKDDE